jgi:probable H4MPT-linked C1 transfer pathway protein
MAVSEGTAPLVIGWDVGGAHLKACLLVDGVVADVAQWICPLWQGLAHLEGALALAAERWPEAGRALHAVTMTGEMTDLFADRADGVQRIAARIEARWPQRVRLYAGPGHWVAPEAAAAAWAQIASANWRATAQLAAQRFGRGLLVDIGSTTTDLIAFDQGRLLGDALSDRDRLASGELVYQGVVRTPLCALAPRIAFQGQALNVMAEFFATTADVYRLTGELDPEHDLYPPADGGAKTTAATQARLARMVGCDARDGSDADWQAFARTWRAAQVDRIAAELARVLALRGLSLDGATLVAAGAGAFLVPALLSALGGDGMRVTLCDFGRDVAPLRPGPTYDDCLRAARLCAPSVAVAALGARGRDVRSVDR